MDKILEKERIIENLEKSKSTCYLDSGILRKTIDNTQTRVKIGCTKTILKHKVASRHICKRYKNRTERKNKSINKNNNDDSNGEPPPEQETNEIPNNSIRILIEKVNQLKLTIETLSSSNIDIINKENKDGLPYIVIKYREDGLSDKEIYKILREKYNISKSQAGVLLYRSSNVINRETYLQHIKRLEKSINM